MTNVLVNELQLEALATEIGESIKKVNDKTGALSELATKHKTSVVGAINELKTQSTAINISDDTTSDNSTWSSNKIQDMITTAQNTIKADVLDSAPEALNTLKELASALNDDANYATTVATQMSNRLRFDETQVLESKQKTQALSNLGLQISTKDFAQTFKTASGVI